MAHKHKYDQWHFCTGCRKVDPKKITYYIADLDKNENVFVVTGSLTKAKGKAAAYADKVNHRVRIDWKDRFDGPWLQFAVA